MELKYISDILLSVKVVKADRGEKGRRLGMYNVLVCDDERDIVSALKIYLTAEGYQVYEAYNGKEALEVLSKEEIHLVLMDIMMPVMDGITAAKTIRAMERKDAKTIPIIAMTANAYEEDIQKTHDAGMNAHLSKPIDIDLMLKTLAIFYSSSKEE